MNHHQGTLSNYHKLILKIFPKSLDLNQGTLYESLLGICNYLAKFSDSKAILTHKKLRGTHF